MSEHLLIVPPEGLLEVVHADRPIDVEATLRGRSHGVLVQVGHEHCTVAFLSDDAGRLNPRARVAFRMFTGVSMIFTGDVMFMNVEEQRMGEVVAALSMRSCEQDLG
jgi:hypothetical protein